MKKLINIFIFITILNFFPTTNVDAKTLGDLKNELSQTEQELKENKEDKQVTEQEMTNINSDIKGIQNTITKNYETIDKLNKEIEILNNDIEEKTQEIKEILNFTQISSGDSAYLEYMFGAKDFTDFIYRTAVAEQMSSYNDTLIEQYNNNIKTNKQKTEQLKQQKIELDKKQKELESKYDSLGSKLEDIVDIQVDIEESIKVQKEIIEMYQKKGCKDTENIATCGKKTLPPDTKFWRPVEYGFVSSNFGYRTYYLGGKKVSDFHTGLDITGKSILGKPVYSTANGTVAAITRKYRCGGNMVYIHHNINGKYYTSLYMHLLTINVSKGQTVTRNTVIGHVGGASTPWDSCSTGAHVHFTLLSGLVGTDYYAFSSKFYAKLLNPRSYVNIPSGSKSFSDRITSY